MNGQTANEESLVYSYLTLRKGIGILGIALPFAVSVGAWVVFRTGLLSSVSAYYYSGMRDVLVGTLWAIGFFLLSYRGHERADDTAGDLACLFAVGIAIFPTAPEGTITATARWIGYVHYLFAALFFLMLIYFSLFLFTKTHPDRPPTPQKLARNRVYRICGYIMAVCVLLIPIYSFLPAGWALPLRGYNPVFWLETIAVEAFGFSWLTKGEAILQDEASS